MKDIQPEVNLLNGIGKQTSRRQVLKGLGLGALALGSVAMLSSTGRADEQNAGVAACDSDGLDGNDAAILNFALNLEYLEAEFYSYATTGAGIAAQGVGINGLGKQGSVIIKANPQVPFVTPAIQQYAMEIARDELRHVEFLRAALGNKAVAQPEINLESSFTAAAQAAGIIGAGQTFDPFADELSFILGSFIFEDVGVTAYHGAAPLLDSKSVLLAAAGILGTEAYHASLVRTIIFGSGAAAQNDAQLISNLRNALGGAGKDQGVVLDGMANIVPTDANGLVFARTVAEVLAIVYFSTTATEGGFFPAGVNTGETSAGK